MRRWLIIWSIGLLAGCAQHSPAGRGPGAVPSSNPDPSSAARSELVPRTDHHVHLLSPAAAALLTPVPLPEIQLPDEFANLLETRVARRLDQRALAELYTEDALYHRGGTVGWARGRDAAAGYVRWTISDWPYRIAPVAFSRMESSAQIAGYFLEGPALDKRFGTSLLSLTRGSDGIWRIVSEVYVFEEPRLEAAYTAAQLVQNLDAVGTRRAVILSNAYYYDAVRPQPVPDEYERVKADNDWTAEQVAMVPDRLVAFCSFNPLRGYALEELERCASSGRFRGVKLNFNAAQLDFHSPEQVERVRRVMAAANRHGLALIIHVRPGSTYGRPEAEVFVRDLLPAALDVPVQIAHLWGGESFASEALAVYADAVSAGLPSTRNLYFDISNVWTYERHMQEIVSRIRQIGLDRILYGSDAPPAEAWARFKRLPLSPAEMATIADNVAPYLR